MNEIILINISGEDKPGLTSSLTSILSRYGVNILDIGQAVIHETLSLGMVVEVPANSAGVFRDLLFKAHQLGVNVRFTPISEERYEKWVSGQGKQRYIVTLLGRRITAEQIARLTTSIAAHGLNIDKIARLSGRVSLASPSLNTRACVEFSVRGAPEGIDAMRAEFMRITSDLDVDIGFQLDNVYRRNRRLVALDMDSTLIQAEVIDELAKAAGVGAEVAKITESAMRGEIDFSESFRSRLRLLKGLEEGRLEEIAQQIPLTDGAERLIGTLRKLGYKTAILSGGFTYFGRRLQKRLGIDYLHANELEIRDGRVTGEVAGEIVDGRCKALLLREIAARENLSLEQVIAVGDGANDLPMLNIAGLGIAFHAKTVVKESARQSISNLGLDGILYLIGLRDRETVVLRAGKFGFRWPYCGNEQVEKHYWREPNVNRKLIVFLFILISYAQSFSAQVDRAVVRGRVVDAKQLPISGAQVRLSQRSINESRQATSGNEGEFIFVSLMPGNYRLEVEHPGHRKHSQDLELFVNQEFRATVALEVDTLQQQEVVVNALLTPLRRDSAAVGTVIENRQIVNLPLDGRNFLELSLLVPGVAPSAPGSAGSVRGDFALNVNGAREDGNAFLLDGAYNVDPKLNTFGVKPPVDAIQEFEVLTSTHDAAFGRNAGGQINIVLKSGTNGFHGTVYEFFRNGALDARNYFAPSNEAKPKYQRNQYGFSLGGPVVKDKTFFFADYEGTRAREGITRIASVPTLLERSGDFSQSFFARPIDPFTQQPFADGRIPVERQHPVGRAIAALYPAPNRPVPFQNFVSSPTLRDRVDQFDARIDHRLSSRSQLAVRYSFGDRYLYDPFSPGFATVPGFGTNIPRRNQNATISETHTFSPSLIHEVRFAYGRVASGSFQENQSNDINRAVGLPALSPNPRDTGLSYVTVTGYSPLGDEYNNPQHSVTNSFQLLDQATYARGRHLVKFGGDFRSIQQNAFRDVQSRGFLTFASPAPIVITGNALADLLIGFPYLTGGARIDNHQHLRTESFNFFAQDSFRIHPKLTLSAGLRYEFNSPPVDTADRANLYDGTRQALVRVGTEGMPRSGYFADKNNWAPRIGLAWTPGCAEQTVVRAGYGVYYDQSALAPGEGLYFNAPYYDLSLYFSLPGLPLTLSNPFPSFFPFALPDSAQAFDRNLRTAYVQHWNFNLQQQFGKARVLELGYVGSKGTKLIAGRDINQPRPSPQPFNPRPVPQFDDINQVESRASSSYHSLQVRLQQRLDFGLSLLSSYTWSQSIDDASGFFTSAGDANYPQDSYNLTAERGRSNFDVRNRFSFSYSYDFPVGRGHSFLGDQGWISGFLSGWQTHGIVTLQTGRPFTVALLREIDQSNTGRANLGFGANDRPNVVGNAKVSRQTPEQWFNPAAFAFPAFGSFGNSGRNILDGPGLQNVNVSLVKQASLSESMNLQVRAEFFNFFNRPNFDLPDIFVGSPTFGRILSAQSPRHIQFGLKFLF